MREPFKPLADAQPTANLRIMEAVAPRFEGMKPLFDQISVNMVNPTVQT